MHFTRQSIRFAYADHGQGPLIVFIHGYPLSRALWQPQIELADAGLRLLAPDLRGHGGSQTSPGPEPHLMETFAADCIALLDHKRIRRPVFFCGLSMGGYVCFALQRLYPERVAGLILTATRPGADSPTARAGRQSAAEIARSQGPQPIFDGMLPKLLSPHSLAERPQLLRQAARLMQRSAGVETIVKDLLGMQTRPDSTPLLSSINKPVLIIHGADDQIIPLSEAEAMQKALPQARLAVLPQAGHLLNLEQPAAFNQAIKGFIEEFTG
jgi:pimeloyl-ACP methyl ester carboxylesterase